MRKSHHEVSHNLRGDPLIGTRHEIFTQDSIKLVLVNYRIPAKINWTAKIV